MKKQHPVSQVLRLIELLDENERQIVRDYLRPRRGSSSKSSSGAQPAGRPSSRKPKVAGPAVNTVADLESVSSAVVAGGN